MSMRSTAFTAALLFLPVAVARGAECNVLTPADIKAVTGADVQAPPAGGSPEHGCPPYKQADGHPYLEVERKRGPDTYQLAVDAIPPDIYTKRTPVSGLGDEAVLLSDAAGRLRSLVARKGEVTVVVSPRTYDKIVGGKVQQKISDAQLKQLAERALAAK
jgi:hypothetical protein